MLKGEEKVKAKKNFKKSIDEIKLNPRFSGTVASNFYSKKQYEFSLKAYLIAKKIFKPKLLFSNFKYLLKSWPN